MNTCVHPQQQIFKHGGLIHTAVIIQRFTEQTANKDPEKQTSPHYMTGVNQKTKNRAVLKLLSDQAVGSHKKQIDTVKGYFQSHEQKEAEEALRELSKNPNSPVERIGGHRDTVHLTSMEEGKEYIKSNGGELPWILQDGVKVRGRQPGR